MADKKITLFLQVKSINQYCSDAYILRGVSLEARSGQVMVLLGRNGVGKTTLLNRSWAWCPSARAALNLIGGE